jgi:hypothetical protein
VTSLFVSSFIHSMTTARPWEDQSSMKLSLNQTVSKIHILILFFKT